MKQLSTKTAGFTLLELLIVIMIFSTMSIMAYGALGNILTSNTVIMEQEKKLKQLQRFMMFVERDMRQIVARSKSNGYNPSSPALIYGLDNDGIIEFTRAGNPNPLGVTRSSLQRVQYDLQDEKLIRKSWNIVDHIDAEPITMPLLDDVEGLSFRFLDNNNAWSDNWGKNIIAIPKAIEMKVEHKNWGEIVRLFLVQ